MTAPLFRWQQLAREAGVLHAHAELFSLAAERAYKSRKRAASAEWFRSAFTAAVIGERRARQARWFAQWLPWWRA